MSGFDTAPGSVAAQTKMFGAVLRGLGPPAPGAGVVGDVYVDTQTYFAYVKRTPNASVDGWGYDVFQIPATYQSGLKWFSSTRPDDTVGVVGDYCLAWSGYPNYGVRPSIYGPKTANGWPENGNGPDSVIDALYGDETLPVGLTDEGTAEDFSTSTQVIVEGLLDEYILAIPVPQAAGTPVLQRGLLGDPSPVLVVLNSLYTAQTQHSV